MNISMVRTTDVGAIFIIDILLKYSFLKYSVWCDLTAAQIVRFTIFF